MSMLVLPVLYFFDMVSLAKFVPLVAVWVFGSMVLFVGPETISELSYGALSIKRDVGAAKKYRDETEAIRDSMQDLARLMAENSYILAATGSLAMGESEARDRIQKNLDELCEYAKPNKPSEEAWWNEVSDLFKDRD